MRTQMFFLICCFILILQGCVSSGSEITNQKSISGEFNYVDGYEPLSGDVNIHVVVEVPTGTVQKWEVDKSDGKLHWEVQDGKLRTVKYLGYPGNYGMVPRTLLSLENGGDGDPVDVLILGPPVERGDVVASKLIGVLKLLDGGEQDDKLIAVMEGTAFYNLNSVEDLKQRFPGVLSIIETWFENYKGSGKLKSLGFSSVVEARFILNEGIKTYELKNTSNN